MSIINDIRSVLRLLDCSPGDRALRTLCIGSDGNAFISIAKAASNSQIHHVERRIANKVINDRLVERAYYGNVNAIRTYRLSRRGLLRLYTRG